MGFNSGFKGLMLNQLRNIWKALKCGAGEGDGKKNSWTDCVRYEEVLKSSKRRGIFYIQKKQGTLTGFVTTGVGTAFYNTLLKER